MDANLIEGNFAADVLDSLMEGFVVYDADGCLITCNRAFREFYNYSDEECRPGVHFRELGKLDIERKTVQLKGITEREYVSRRDNFHNEPLGEFLVKLSDGRILQTRDQRTKSGGVVSVQTDVTELFEKTESLARSTGRLSTLLLSNNATARECVDQSLPDNRQCALIDDTLRAVFRTMPAVAYSVSLATGEVIFVSPNVVTVTGYSPEEILAVENWWLDGVHPEDRERCHGVFEKLEKGVNTINHEYRFRHKSGHYIWVHDQLFIETDTFGKPTKIVGSWLDITHVVEERSKAALVSALDNLNIGIVSIDKAGQVATTNRRADSILESNDGLSIDSVNKLTVPLDNENRKLRQIIDDISNMPKGEFTPKALSITRPSQRHDYSIVVIPVSMMPIKYEYYDCRAIVFVSDPEWRIESSTYILSELYGLTKSESRVVAAIVSGYSIKDTARRLNLAESTVRQYLKAAFNKTRTNSQAGLIRKILGGPASLWLD